MTVWYDQFNTPETLATGLVLRGENKLKIDKDIIAYADPTDNQKAWGTTIFVGLLYPNGVDETGKFETINHALGLKKNYHGEPFTYYFGSAWSAYDMPTFCTLDTRMPRIARQSQTSTNPNDTIKHEKIYYFICNFTGGCTPESQANDN